MVDIYDDPKLHAAELKNALEHPKSGTPLIIGYYTNKLGPTGRIRIMQAVKGGNPKCTPPNGMEASEAIAKLKERHCHIRNSKGFLKILRSADFDAFKAKTWTEEKQKAHRAKYGQPEPLPKEERLKKMKEGLQKANETRAKKRMGTKDKEE